MDRKQISDCQGLGGGGVKQKGIMESDGTHSTKYRSDKLHFKGAEHIISELYLSKPDFEDKLRFLSLRYILQKGRYTW